MKILQVGLFHDHELGGCIVFNSGLKDNGHIVDTFDYRTRTKELGKEGMNEELSKIARQYDLLFIGKGELIYPESLVDARRKGCVMCLWYGDVRSTPEEWLLRLLSEIDVFYMTSGGETLRTYVERGHPGLGVFFFNPSLPAFAENYLKAEIDRNIPVLFTGTGYGFAGKERGQTVKYLNKRKDARIVGGAEDLVRGAAEKKIRRVLGLSSKRVRGAEYYDLLRRAKIGIGVSAYQSIFKYTSDRMTHYMELGVFYLCWEFPGLQELFVPGEDLVTFSSVDDLAEKIDYYLSHDSEREKIAMKGCRRVLEEYNSRRMTKMMLDTAVNHSSSEYSWVEIVKGRL